MTIGESVTATNEQTSRDFAHRPQRPDKPDGGKRFVIKSEYEPAGDQP